MRLRWLRYRRWIATDHSAVGSNQEVGGRSTLEVITLLIGPSRVASDVVLPRRLGGSAVLDVARPDERADLRRHFDAAVGATSIGRIAGNRLFGDSFGNCADYFVLRGIGDAGAYQYDQHICALVGRLRQPAIKEAVTLFVQHEPHQELPQIGARWRPTITAELSDINSLESTPITSQRLDLMSTDFKRYNELDPIQHSHILESINLFVDSFSIDRTHALHLLGLFISVESLLVHAPNPTDPVDSIARQLQRAVPLVLRRFGTLEDYDFGQLPADRLMKQLYGVRSAIAHGSPLLKAMPGQLKAAIGGLGEIRDLVERLAQDLLCQALAEPDLIVDLRGPSRR